jgi:hypothetical protein
LSSVLPVNIYFSYVKLSLAAVLRLFRGPSSAVLKKLAPATVPSLQCTHQKHTHAHGLTAAVAGGGFELQAMVSGAERFYGTLALARIQGRWPLARGWPELAGHEHTAAAGSGQSSATATANYGMRGT